MPVTKTTPTVETWAPSAITPERARAIAELLNQVWPKPNLTVDDLTAQIQTFARDYSGPAELAPRSHVVLDGERVVAHALVFARTIRTADGEMTIAALARVCADPEQRGRGLGEAVTLASFAAVDRGSFPFSLFQTSEFVRPFYEKLGAVTVDNPFINSLAEGPKTNPFWHQVVMRYPARGPWPNGTIDLRGPGY